MAHRVEVSREMAASPHDVYAAVSDVTRMGEWSEECYACAWQEGSNAAAVDAVFDGHNRNGEHRWTTQGRVIEADPGRSFAFECSMHGFHYSTWGYRLEPTRTGCRVTEWTEDLRPDEVLGYAEEVSGVADRTDRVRSAERNRSAMVQTLERLAQAVERDSGAGTGQRDQPDQGQEEERGDDPPEAVQSDGQPGAGGEQHQAGPEKRAQIRVQGGP